MKKKQFCKPGSVFGKPNFVIYLGMVSQPNSISPPTDLLTMLSLGEQPSKVSLFGFSVYEVYSVCMLPHKLAGSYPAFSPLPFDNLRAVIFCNTVCILREQNPSC